VPDPDEQHRPDSRIFAPRFSHVTHWHAGKDKSALICGSVAYDTIMVFPDRFKAHILPDKLHMLNVAFLVPQMRREFGGCAGNIAYNLKLLGDVGYPMGGIGLDFGRTPSG
jgi:hypothetical protein